MASRLLKLGMVVEHCPNRRLVCPHSAGTTSLRLQKRRAESVAPIDIGRTFASPRFLRSCRRNDLPSERPHDIVMVG